VVDFPLSFAPFESANASCGNDLATQNMPRERRRNTKAKVARARVSNGSKLFLPGVDGRSAIARRTRDIFDQLCADLGGFDLLSEAQTQLCRRAAMISIRCEEMEAESVAGQRMDLELYGKLTDRLGRVLQRLGIERTPRDVTPSVKDYVEHINAHGT
jgi:hypothetical protein